MMYELGLAQLMSCFMGNTALRYATTIGVYLVSMGIGALLFRSKNVTDDAKTLFAVELALAVLGMVTPFLFIYGDAHLSGMLTVVLCHVTIAAVGFIVGYELPILSSLAQNRISYALVLSWDYAGMFLASLLFPILIFPWLGAFASLWLTTALNLVALALTFKWTGKSSARMAALACGVLANLALLWWSGALMGALSEVYARAV